LYKNFKMQKEEILALHSLASLRKPEITNNVESLVLYFKEVFDKEVTKEQLQQVLEPTVEEDEEDLRLIYSRL
jgi:hypothetical protein